MNNTAPSRSNLLNWRRENGFNGMLSVHSTVMDRNVSRYTKSTNAAWPNNIRRVIRHLSSRTIHNTITKNSYRHAHHTYKLWIQIMRGSEILSRQNLAKLVWNTSFVTSYVYTTTSTSMAQTFLFTRKHAILTHLPHTARQNKDIGIQSWIFMFLCSFEILYVLTLYQLLYLPLFNNETGLDFHSKHTPLQD